MATGRWFYCPRLFYPFIPVETYYPRAGARARNKKGVEKRAGLIPGEYKRPLAALDTRYHRVEEGQTGPLVRRLERFGNILTWVIGAWQEGSKDLHDLLDLLADHKVAVLGLARGREASEIERAQILSGYRRTLSTTAASASSGCLLGRLAKVGEAHRGAARRRTWALRVSLDIFADIALATESSGQEAFRR